MDVEEEEEEMMMLRRKTDPKTGKHVLCEPAQAKCTWTFEKSHFVWIFFRESASLRNRNTHGHVTRAILSANLQ